MSNQEFDWKKFQKRLGYSDEEVEHFRSDPHRAKAAKKIFSPDIVNKCLIFEVVESHGCSANMKKGDRLYFRALSILDTKRSSPWCAHAMGFIPAIANMVQDRYVAGIDPNEMIYNHTSCMDVGCKNGWGQISMKAYMVDEKDMKE
jgi:uncharacterized repeat protein (TIGR04076 family)